MFCVQCGTKLNDDALFCTNCGARVERESVGAHAKAQPGAAQQSLGNAAFGASAQEGSAGGSSYASGQGGNFASSASGPAPYTSGPSNMGGAPVPPGMPVSPELEPQSARRGCFGSAWDDVLADKNWVKRTALMALVSLVPVLNWVNYGYSLNWGKSVVYGRKDDLSGKLITGDNFKLGFFVIVISLVAGIVIGLESSILMILPVLGLIAALALAIFGSMFTSLACMRTALYDLLGEGFSVGKIMEGFKRNLGTLFCVTFVPALIGGAIASIVSMLFLLVGGAISGFDLVALSSATARYGSYGWVPADAFEAMGPMAIVVVLLGIVAVFVSEMAMMFATLVTQRGLGYYVQRNVPEWANETSGARVEPGSYWGGQAMQGVAPQPPAGGAGMQPMGAAGAPQASGPIAAAGAAPAAEVAPTVGAAVVAAPVAAATAVASAQAGAPEPAPAPEPTREPAHAAPSHAAAPVEDDYAETAVLPEYPEDLDTVVQPEEPPAPVAAPEPEPEIAPAPTPEPEPVAQPVSQPAPEPQPAPAPVAAAASAPAPAPQTAAAPSLTLIRANGDMCTITTFPLTVGKGSDAGLIIDNPTVSRVHLQLLSDSGMFAAMDLGSTNKTYVAGYEIAPNTPTILSDGDELRLGNEVLKVRIG